jgi:hypothetical protein
VSFLRTVGVACKRTRAASIRATTNRLRLRCRSNAACAAAVAAFPSAGSVSVHAAVGARALAAILRTRRVRHLSVRWLIDSPEPILRHVGLRTFQLGTPLADPFAFTRPPTSSSAPSLERLTISPAPHLRDLASLLHLGVTSLHVAGTDRLTLSALDTLRPRLVELSVTECTRLAGIGYVRHLTTLTHLRVSTLKPFLTSRVVLDASDLPRSLVDLDLEGVRFALDALAGLSCLTRLRVARGASAPDFACLAGLPLRRLDYAGTTTDGTLYAIGLESLPPTIESLRLATCAVHCLPFDRATLRALTELSLEYLPVPVANYAALVDMRSLRELDVWLPNTGADPLHVVVEAFRCVRAMRRRGSLSVHAQLDATGVVRLVATRAVGVGVHGN